MIDTESVIVDVKNLTYASKIIIPKTCVTPVAQFSYHQNYETINIKASCEEGSTTTKSKSIKDCLQETQEKEK